MLRTFPLGFILGTSVGWSLFRSFAPLLFGPIPMLKQPGFFWVLCAGLTLLGALGGGWAQHGGWVRPESRAWKLITANYVLLSCLLSTDPMP
jgi:hypothetical protein